MPSRHKEDGLQNSTCQTSIRYLWCVKVCYEGSGLLIPNSSTHTHTNTLTESNVKHPRMPAGQGRENSVFSCTRTSRTPRHYPQIQIQTIVTKVIMNWTRENTLYFIHLIRERPAIWDATSTEFKHKYKRNDALDEVAKMMNITVRDVNTKWTSLRGQFNREKKKFKGVRGPDATPVISKWFAYSSMEDMMRYSAPVNSYIIDDNHEILIENSDYLEAEESVSNKAWSVETSTDYPNWQNEKSKEEPTNGSPKPINQTQRDTESMKRARPNWDSENIQRSHDQKLNMEYDTFGLYVAAQMKSLTEEDAVLAQAEINEIMTRYRLKKARRKDEQAHQTNQSGLNHSSPIIEHNVQCIVKCEVESD